MALKTKMTHLNKKIKKYWTTHYHDPWSWYISGFRGIIRSIWSHLECQVICGSLLDSRVFFFNFFNKHRAVYIGLVVKQACPATKRSYDRSLSQKSNCLWHGSVSKYLGFCLIPEKNVNINIKPILPLRLNLTVQNLNSLWEGHRRAETAYHWYLLSFRDTLQ